MVTPTLVSYPSRPYLSLVLAVLAALGCTAEKPPGRVIYELRNGHWFDGSRFADRTVWVTDSVFSFAKPQRVDSVIDLAGGWVVPPYAEAHNHWIEPTVVRAYAEKYLLEGVFYVQDLSNSPVIRVHTDSVVNRRESVDYIAAGPGYTGPGAHPLEQFELIVKVGIIPKPRTREELEQYVIVARTKADIERTWPRVLAGRPDIIKLFLGYSEEYARRVDDDRYGEWRGLDPALVPEVVRRAHEAGLPVAAHIHTAADFHTAVTEGVDIVAHLPFYHSRSDSAASLISVADAKLAAERHIPITTTLSWLTDLRARDSAGAERAKRTVVLPNLRTLRDAGVVLLVGSDQFRKTSTVEAQLLASLGMFTPAELLRMWSETSALAIFPTRRIGRLADGYEASFLVLDGDPLQDFTNTGRIRLRMKQGLFLHPMPERAVFPRLPGEDD